MASTFTEIGREQMGTKVMVLYAFDANAAANGTVDTLLESVDYVKVQNSEAVSEDIQVIKNSDSGVEDDQAGSIYVVPATTDNTGYIKVVGHN